MLTLPLPHLDMSVWMPLLGSGIGLSITPGETLQKILFHRLSIDKDYLEKRIQTIIVNSSAVDDPDQVRIADGDVVALSAAMPGLVGTTLRRGSHLAPMREAITNRNKTASTSPSHSAVMTLKLFNMVASELGPPLLKRPIHLKKKDLDHLRNHYPTLPASKLDPGAQKWIHLKLIIDH